MAVSITEKPFNPWDELQTRQDNLSMAGQYGATAVFVGTMRDFNEGDKVKAMTLEHYPGMTEKYLEKIILQAERQWELMHTLVIHRVGHILPDESIVLVAVWAAHRANAFDASRYIMEELKSHAPFWKKETLEDGDRWVGKGSEG
ncbi:MAG TPA: molybdenum cofactor biosynthesis protein MoaE [Gammaproteobacteria bacterium]|nr:molybdenum cofactor biosynthesis protein MoaE [Gammaproteobacteria bacterium]